MCSSVNSSRPAARWITATAAPKGIENCASTIEAGWYFWLPGSATIPHPASRIAISMRRISAGGAPLLPKISLTASVGPPTSREQQVGFAAGVRVVSRRRGGGEGRSVFTGGARGGGGAGGGFLGPLSRERGGPELNRGAKRGGPAAVRVVLFDAVGRGSVGEGRKTRDGAN